jgi:hypothetical protein
MQRQILDGTLQQLGIRAIHWNRFGSFQIDCQLRSFLLCHYRIGPVPLEF